MIKLIKGVNDLETLFPELAKEWHPTKNGELSPSDVTAGSGKEAWWLGKCGHVWKTKVYSRTRLNSNCPYCSNQKVLIGYNDLATTNPELADEWHPKKNRDLLPTHFTRGSNKKIWWLGKCGHEWIASISDRTGKDGTGCPFCSGQKLLKGFNDLQTVCPDIAQEWHPTKNGDLLPTQYTKGSNTKIWWLGKCGHEWQAIINDRSRGSGCPYCSNKSVLPG